jgi:hypothetical protein|eukprot:CAMPEP_0119219204 /NCGR_PEP_ID=MMETSP1327-20130426/22901_1 /TAXON_ID=38833 /ORGANISM="Micromonas pusilla, Strain RCC2306" /LENGTH=48 /DNA_ID= /DNA_START= /DNA_END= /DNA_ORIENTATION=
MPQMDAMYDPTKHEMNVVLRAVAATLAATVLIGFRIAFRAFKTTKGTR